MPHVEYTAVVNGNLVVTSLSSDGLRNSKLLSIIKGYTLVSRQKFYTVDTGLVMRDEYIKGTHELTIEYFKVVSWARR